jgi:hypothetical protein
MPKKNSTKYYIAIIFSFLLSVIGFLFGIRLADQLTPSNDRTPASIASHLLANLNYKKLFETVVVFKSLDAQGVEFGAHFTPNSNKTLDFICNVYPNMELHFKAEGMAVSGEIPKMILRGPCVKHKTKEKIEALRFNANTIMSTTPKDKTLKSVQNNVHIDFYDLSDSWPPTWLLTEIRFLKLNDADKQDLIIDSSEIRDSGITIQLDW